MSKHLITRNKMNAKKPEFQRQDSNIFKQFEGKWRKPKGMHSKLRKGYRGHAASPSIGYSAPSDVHGLTRKGLIPFVVSNLKELENLTNSHAVIIAHGVGMKKRIHMLNKIKEKKLHVLGLKDADILLGKYNEKLNLKKKESIVKKEEKKKKIEQAQVKAQEKKDEPKK